MPQPPNTATPPADEGQQLIPIAHIHNDFPTKFGLPRQSGLVADLPATIVFTPTYRNADALRGIEGFSHLWLIWSFSQAKQATWSPTVRPPRLGGNQRIGVFASRSPYRPNSLGLSSVRLLAIHHDPHYGDILQIAGADLMNGTPIYDIKPYLPFTDSHPEATGGFAAMVYDHQLSVVFPPTLLALIPVPLRQSLIQVLAQDPRPAYITDPSRSFGFAFGDFDIRFQVAGKVLTVHDVITLGDCSG